VCDSNADSFKKGIESDLPGFMKTILRIKSSERIFNAEGVVITLWRLETRRQRNQGYLKSTDEGKHLLVAVNNANCDLECRIPKRMRKLGKGCVYSDKGRQITSLPRE
jgi:hypothetical protein